jgi:excinuclease ABC subunit B
MSQFLYDADALALPLAADAVLSKGEVGELIKQTEKQMMAYADQMEFEKAAAERDRLIVLREMDLGVKPALRSLLAEAKDKHDQRPTGRKSQPRKYRRKR